MPDLSPIGSNTVLVDDVISCYQLLHLGYSGSSSHFRSSLLGAVSDTSGLAGLARGTLRTCSTHRT